MVNAETMLFMVGVGTPRSLLDLEPAYVIRRRRIR
jgi:hypothetical protein